VTRSPADAIGNVALIGAATLQGGSLNGEDFAVIFTGTITPPPA
jgi:hypothetical protein